MAILKPLPLGVLLRRLHREHDRERKIFDLPEREFYRGDPLLDTSVAFHGHTASTPAGPAAGPQDQLVQNIVLSWLGGGRIIELKTVQILDQLKLPRPCIDATNVGYNVEWSQELTLEESLREYVAASMVIEILRDMNVLGHPAGAAKDETIFDMSVGYDLAGIRTERVRGWIETMMNAGKIIDSLRREIPEEFARYREFPFKTRISDSITLSTFHGCPADEIERITEFLLREVGVHMVVKLNPTLLGKPAVDEILHERLGYSEIDAPADAFEHDLQFDQCLEIVDRLGRTARLVGRQLGVKFSNTLVVQNHRAFFPASEQRMYLSGQPLHVLTMTLVKKFRDATGHGIPISFSAGIDQHNFADAVACGFVPVTVCTDLLRPGGYGRFHKYMENLEARMRVLGVATLGDFVVAAEGRGAEGARLASTSARDAGSPGAATADTHGAGLDKETVAIAAALNTAPIVQRVLHDPRYAAAKNRGAPRKIGSHLVLYDCVSCNKCVPVCPNDANFRYDVEPVESEFAEIVVTSTGPVVIPRGIFRVERAEQWGTYADFCNECGNCDVFCPEEGGPYIEKARIFSCEETYAAVAPASGFLIERGASHQSIRGRIGGREYWLEIDDGANVARFHDEFVDVDADPSTGATRAVRARDGAPLHHSLSMRVFFVMRTLLRGVLDPRRANYTNV
ncbi:MAG: glutamate synthase [bacterium]